MPVLVKANEATAARRRVYFQLVDATDFATPETGEASGQPQVSTNGGAWTNTGIGTLTAVGNGRYYADLTQTLVATAGDSIETRYKSANTAECPGDSVRVVAFDPYDAAGLGLTNLDATVSSRSTYAGADTSGTTTLLSRIGTPASGSIAADIAALPTATTIWANATRTLTANPGLDAAGVRSAVGLASANLDTQLDTLPTAAEVTTAVWANGTRTLTAGTNIVLAKGTGITGFNDIAAADVVTALGTGSTLTALATAASITTLTGYVDTEVAAIKAKTDQLTFTATGQVDANTRSVNDVRLTGTGVLGDEWGPA